MSGPNFEGEPSKPTIPFKVEVFDVPGGRLTIQPVAAWTDERSQDAPVPRLEVKGGVVLRKRPYTIDEVMHWTTWDAGRGVEVQGWGAHYLSRARGYRKAGGTPVEFRSPTHKTLAQMVRGVLDEYASRWPQWADWSLRLRKLAEIRWAEAEVAGLQEDLSRAVARVAELRSKAGKDLFD